MKKPNKTRRGNPYQPFCRILNHDIDLKLVGVSVIHKPVVAICRGRKKLASLAGNRFKMGVLLYDGTETMPLGNGIWAVPLSTLWGEEGKAVSMSG